MQFRREAQHAIGKSVQARAVGSGIAILGRIFAVVRFLIPASDLRHLDRARPLPAPVEADPVAPDRIAPDQADHAGRGAGRWRNARKAVGIGVIVEMIERQAQAVSSRGRKDQLGQHRVGLGVLRIGGGAGGIGGVIAALVLLLMPIAAGIGDQRRPRARLPRQNCGLGGLVVGGIIGEAGQTGHFAAAFEEILRVAGDEADRARQTIAAIKRGGRAAQDLDRFDKAQIDIIAAPGGLRAKFETIGHAHAIDLHQHAIALKPADVETGIAVAPGGAAGRAKTRRGAMHRNARFETDQVLDVGGHLVGNLARADDRNGGGDFADGGGAAGGGNGDGIHRIERDQWVAVLRHGGGRCGKTGRSQQHGAGGVAPGQAKAGEKEGNDTAPLNAIDSQ